MWQMVTGGVGVRKYRAGLRTQSKKSLSQQLRH